MKRIRLLFAANSGVSIIAIRRKVLSDHQIQSVDYEIGCAPLLAISQLIRDEVADWYSTISPHKLVCLSVVA
ncbi:hypothetical protein D910_04683 [Dendroctonus ponderosae]